MTKHEPSLLIVGAGPGDPELITMKGLEAIRQADVILHDALVSSELIKKSSTTLQTRLCWQKKRT